MAREKLRLDELDQSVAALDRHDYETRLANLQTRVLRVQQAYFHEKRRAVVVFEGWDAAGKGGAIRRLTERLDPRGCKVWPIAAPKPEEQGRHYLYRFWTRLPEPGTIAVFDRSWYGRVLVERIEGFASRREWQRAYREINEFEHMLAADGVRIIKLFLHITPDEQLKRFAERLRNPYKRWKLTEEDIRNRQKWADYKVAIEEMFDKTSTDDAPWVAIAGNHKWEGRLSVLHSIAKHLGHGVNLDPPSLDPAVQAAAAERLGLSAEDVDDIRDVAAVTGEEDEKGKKAKGKPGRKKHR